MVRIALTGTGFMGKTHLTVYSRLSDAEVVALCDKSEERLASAGSAPGGNIETASSAVDLSNVRTYTDYAQMLSDGGFDVVDICLPTYLHAQHSLDALAAGYHVFCEKPMALDLHIHDSDLVLYYFGMPDSVRSVGAMEPDGGVSHISTVYGFPGKAVTATGGWICSSSFGFTMRATMVFEGATVVFNSSADAPLTVYPEGGAPEVPQLAPEDGYYYELEDFLRGVAAGKLSGVVTGESAADAVRLCRAEIRSAIEGREIDL